MEGEYQQEQHQDIQQKLRKKMGHDHQIFNEFETKKGDKNEMTSKSLENVANIAKFWDNRANDVRLLQVLQVTVYFANLLRSQV